jgi:hypothetical protein
LRRTGYPHQVVWFARTPRLRRITWPMNHVIAPVEVPPKQSASRP